MVTQTLNEERKRRGREKMLPGVEFCDSFVSAQLSILWILEDIWSQIQNINLSWYFGGIQTKKSTVDPFWESMKNKIDCFKISSWVDNRLDLYGVQNSAPVVARSYEAILFKYKFWHLVYFKMFGHCGMRGFYIWRTLQNIANCTHTKHTQTYRPFIFKMSTGDMCGVQVHTMNRSANRTIDVSLSLAIISFQFIYVK